jgi:hypothetical protein
MAERRMVSKVISISEKVNSLSLFGRLLYTWMIPHADDFGRLPGSPAKVKFLVVPMADESKQDVEQALADMDKIGVIQWYEIEGEQFIQITNFDEHQTGLHKRTKSKFPEPPEKITEISGPVEELPGNSGGFPLNRTELNRTEGNGTEGNGTEGNGTEGNGTEGNGTEEDARPVPSPENIESIKVRVHSLIDQVGIKKYSIYDLDVLCSYLRTVDFEVIEAAIKKSSGKQHINYAINTLNGMISEGITRREQIIDIPEPGVSMGHGPPAASGQSTPNRQLSKNEIAAQKIREARERERERDQGDFPRD